MRLGPLRGAVMLMTEEKKTAPKPRVIKCEVIRKIAVLVNGNKTVYRPGDVAKLKKADFDHYNAIGAVKYVS